MKEGMIPIEGGGKEDIAVSRRNTLSLMEDIRLTNTIDRNTTLTTPSTGHLLKDTARDGSVQA